MLKRAVRTASVSSVADEREKAAAHGRLSAVLVTAALVTAAVNLRPAISSLGALLEEVQAGLGMSASVAGLLTALPLMSFVVFGSVAPRLSRRIGPAAAMCTAMATVAIGLGLRPFVPGGAAPFLAFSCLALAGIGVSNVLMPVVVKRYFPQRVGLMTGTYSMALVFGASAAAATTVPLTASLGGSWRWGLAIWALPAALAGLIWLGLVRDRCDAQPLAPSPVSSRSLRIMRSPTAWALGVFFGLQATGAYVVLGWLPQIFRDAGVSAQAAGLLLAATPAIGIPVAFALPTVAGRLRSARVGWPPG